MRLENLWFPICSRGRVFVFTEHTPAGERSDGSRPDQLVNPVGQTNDESGLRRSARLPRIGRRLARDVPRFAQRSDQLANWGREFKCCFRQQQGKRAVGEWPLACQLQLVVIRRMRLMVMMIIFSLRAMMVIIQMIRCGGEFASVVKFGQEVNPKVVNLERKQNGREQGHPPPARFQAGDRGASWRSRDHFGVLLISRICGAK